MLISPIIRRQLPLTKRILLHLEHRGEPCHYTTMARVLHAPDHRVQQACWHMAQDGRLRWCGEGMYAISTPLQKE